MIPATYDIDFIVLEGDDKVDEIGNLLYEENSSLDPVAEKFNLKVQRITRLDLNAPAMEVENLITMLCELLTMRNSGQNYFLTIF